MVRGFPSADLTPCEDVGVREYQSQRVAPQIAARPASQSVRARRRDRERRRIQAKERGKREGQIPHVLLVRRGKQTFKHEEAMPMLLDSSRTFVNGIGTNII